MSCYIAEAEHMIHQIKNNKDYNSHLWPKFDITLIQDIEQSINKKKFVTRGQIDALYNVLEKWEKKKKIGNNNNFSKNKITNFFKKV